MTNITKEIIAGLILGIVSTIPMFFMTFENRTRTMNASFITEVTNNFPALVDPQTEYL